MQILDIEQAAHDISQASRVTNQGSPNPSLDDTLSHNSNCDTPEACPNLTDSSSDEIEYLGSTQGTSYASKGSPGASKLSKVSNRQSKKSKRAIPRCAGSSQESKGIVQKSKGILRKSKDENQKSKSGLLKKASHKSMKIQTSGNFLFCFCAFN